MNLIEEAARAGVQGFLHPEEAAKLEEMATGRDVLEVGSFKGLSAWIMARVARAVTCVDTFRACDNGQDQREDFQTLDAFRKATDQFSNVTAYIGTSENAAEDLHGEWDFIFIDAMHTAEDVLADIRRWWPRVRKGGGCWLCTITGTATFQACSRRRMRCSVLLLKVLPWLL